MHGVDCGFTTMGIDQLRTRFWCAFHVLKGPGMLLVRVHGQYLALTAIENSIKYNKHVSGALKIAEGKYVCICNLF